jgi:hypothetical protein
MRFPVAAIAGLAPVLSAVIACPAAAAPQCQLHGRPHLEGRLAGAGRPSALAAAVDARLGEAIDVFITAPGTLNGRAVLFSESGARGRVSWVTAGCPRAEVTWRRVEPRMQHDATPAPNADVALYANAVIFGPRHGAWIGFDRLEYFESALEGGGGNSSRGGWALRVRDATPAEPFARHRAADLLPLGTMRLTAEIAVGGAKVTAPGADDAPGGMISARVFRYTIRRGDGFLGWMTSYFNIPYLFGSAGKGARSQAERYIGADCADILVAALRRAGGTRLDYSSVVDLVGRLRRVGGPVELAPCDSGAATPCPQAGPRLRFGTSVAPGDLLALDYVGATDLPRAWDHIVAVVEDRGPGGGAPDGLLGPEDLVADSGSAEGLRFAPLGEQGRVRITVLRPR